MVEIITIGTKNGEIFLNGGNHRTIPANTFSIAFCLVPTVECPSKNTAAELVASGYICQTGNNHLAKRESTPGITLLARMLP